MNKFPFEIEREYKEVDAQWEHVDNEVAYERLEGSYTDMVIVTEALDEGQVLPTCFAYYRKATQEDN